MNGHRRVMLLAAIGTLVLSVGSVSAEAGGGFEVHFGSAGVGFSAGYGNWGVYTAAWSQPRWSFDYDAVLSGYGEWVWVNGLGRVWRPWVKVGWQPYTYGRWVMTTYGWTWVAYEPWGYFPHHYGNWALTSFGWVWAPGYTYHAAGVVWVRAGSYVGWYAAPPKGWCHADHGFRPGYNRGYRDGYNRGYDDGWRDARYATYVSWKHFGSDNVSHYRVADSVASRSRVQTLDHSPSAREVREHGGAQLFETRIATRSAEVGGHQVLLARPVGVAASVERHASETVRGTLSTAAINARQPTARGEQSSPRNSSRLQPTGRRDPIVPAREEASQKSPRTLSSSWSANRSETRAPGTEVRSTDARMVQRAPETSPMRVEARQPAERVSSRVSRTAAPRSPFATDSRTGTGRDPVRATPRPTGDARGYIAKEESRTRVGVAGSASSEAVRTNGGGRRVSSQKGSATAEDTEERPGNDRSPRRTGARRR